MSARSARAPVQPGEELVRLREEAARLRAEIAALRARKGRARDEAAHPRPEDWGRMAQMREANENLVIATVHAQEMTEAAERTIRDKEQFLAMLAHELRNPLAPIVGALAMLRRITHADPMLPWIHDVLRRQIDQLAQLLGDLLEVSRMSAGKVVLKMRPTGASDFMLSAVELSEPLILSRKQKLTVEVPVEPLMIEGDATRLTQIFGNLLNNAAKYTREGGRITFSAQQEGDNLVVRVADNGVGITAEALPRIFELFTQEDRSLARSQGGLGVGLTVVRSLVELHGGAVEASSPGEGQGSEFSVTLPLLKGVPAAPYAASEAAVEPPGERYRIVLIEDNVDANDSLKSVLEMVGHEVCSAFDGSAGASLARQSKPHIVLCDIGLPGMDGYQVMANLKETVSPMPVMIALTGYGQKEDRMRALAAGFDHHLTKPVDVEGLLRLIAGYAERLSRLTRPPG